MPAINIPEIEPKVTVKKAATYVDVTMDLKENNMQLDDNLYKPVDSTDIDVSVDEGAIKNSLVNLFNTTPGQKVLQPEFGLELKRFLFEPLTDLTAKLIAETIYKGIARWETRVQIGNVDVQKDYDNRQFEISLTLMIPKLSNSTVSFTGILSQEQFTQTS